MSELQKALLLFFIMLWILGVCILIAETIAENVKYERKIKQQQIQIKRNRYELQKQLFLKSLYC